MKVTVFSSPFDPALQSQQIDDAIAQKFDLFVVQTISQKAIIPPLTRAKNAGIPVVLIVVPLVGDETKDLYLSYIGYEDEGFGRSSGEQMVKALKEGGRTTAKVAVIAGSMAEGKAPIRDQAFRDAIAKQPGLEVVVTEDVKWNPADRRARRRPAARPLRRPGRARRHLRHERQPRQRRDPGGGSRGREARQPPRASWSWSAAIARRRA